MRSYDKVKAMGGTGRSLLACALALPAALMAAGAAVAATGATSDPAVLERIAPVGKVRVSEATADQTQAQPLLLAEAGADAGKATYDKACAMCHGSGMAGAPKLGDKDAWAPRIAQGMDTLSAHAIGGFKGMPAKGGNTSLSDDDVKAAVQYMVGASK
jgi:cytochrome c5